MSGEPTDYRLLKHRNAECHMWYELAIFSLFGISRVLNHYESSASVLEKAIFIILAAIVRSSALPQPCVGLRAIRWLGRPHDPQRNVDDGFRRTVKNNCLEFSRKPFLGCSQHGGRKCFDKIP